MNTKTKISVSLTLLALISIAASFLVIPSKANAETFTPNYYAADTNAFPLQLTNNQAKVLSGKKIPINPNQGISLFIKVGCTNSGAIGSLIGFDLYYNITNGTTTHPLTWGIPPPSGTNTYWTNIPASYLNNARYLQATWATNATTGAHISNTITYSEFVFSYNNVTQ